mmetsp:Transcript_28774/g.31962  ORF Transcript_28774/g.31962 Transcript_28774/m.31962 type:complete len:451 (-) Transcript_28774:137-1489(-)
MSFNYSSIDQNESLELYPLQQQQQYSNRQPMRYIPQLKEEILPLTDTLESCQQTTKAVTHWHQKATKTITQSPVARLRSDQQHLRKYVYWSTVKVDQGKKIGVWDSEGTFSIVSGPKCVTLYKSEYIFLRHQVATPDDYITVEYQDGTKEIIPGPHAIWLDPSEHKLITVTKKIPINQNESVIVYYQTAKKEVERKIIKGPLFYVPEPNSWMHKFNWNKGQAFSKLMTTPDTMDVDVEYVRTADDALLNINLRVFFQINDVLRMIDASGDPISDLSNAIASDIIQAVAKVEFKKFKSMTESLNDINTYKEMLDMAKDIGYHVHKVVFKGFQAGKALQQMVDEGIKRRALLLLQEDKDKHHQQHLDLKLDAEQARAANENKLHAEEAKHKIDIEKLSMELEAQKHREFLKHLETTKEESAKKDLEFLKQLKSLGVDLTKYLVSTGGVPTME